jgi:hypothetical protein
MRQSRTRAHYECTSGSVTPRECVSAKTRIMPLCGKLKEGFIMDAPAGCVIEAGVLDEIQARAQSATANRLQGQ